MLKTLLVFYLFTAYTTAVLHRKISKLTNEVGKLKTRIEDIKNIYTELDDVINELKKIQTCDKAPIEVSCEPEYGIKYSGHGCTFKTLQNVTTWAECGYSCYNRLKCKNWSWEHADSSLTPFTCHLKTGSCKEGLMSDFISGSRSCPGNPVQKCGIKYGLDYLGRDIKCVGGITTWQACSKLCKETKDCVVWTWLAKKFTEVQKGRYHECCLKKSIPPLIPLQHVVSGDPYTHMYC